MSGKDIAVVIITAVVGGSGIVGLLFFFVRRYLEGRLADAEKAEQKNKARRIERLRIEDELYHCYGRLLFWIYRFIQTGQHNGELKEAFENLQKAETKKKELDRDIIADSEID